jgi:3',5'-cyclic AMP phosphodiesterase CpdA
VSGIKVRQIIFFLSIILLSVSVNIKLTKAEDVNMQDYMSKYSSLSNDNIITTKNDDGSWSIKKTDDGDFKVLQLTDVHLSAGDVYTERNKKAMDAVYTIVEQERPDLIEMTGDYVFAMPYTDPAQDYETFKMCVAFMDKLGVPWIWTFGNHDHDFFDRYSDEQVHAMLDTSNTLIKYDINYNVDGYTNGEFRLYNSDDTLNRILISLDSHDYVSDNDYDYVHDNQVAWYENLINNDKKLFGEDVQSFVYTHIPLMEYNDAWNGFQAGDTRAEYILGTKREDVCCSSFRGKLGTSMSNLKSTQAIFCGHDHLNDYMIKYCGVIYAYSKSIDYSAYVDIEYKTEQRGATMLTLNYDGVDYDITSIKLTDIQNTSNSYSNDIKPTNTISTNGLKLDSDGIWRYYVNGILDSTYTGMALNEYGWWYVTDGVIDFSYTGMALNEYGWWYMTNGVVDFDYTGMAENEYGWWYITNGALDLSYTGMALNKYNWWYMRNGAVDFDYTGMAENEYGWWYITNGALDFNYTGMALNEYGWWYMANGALDLSYTGIAQNEYGSWYMTNGRVNFRYTEKVKDNNGVWQVNNGFAINQVKN